MSRFLLNMPAIPEESHRCQHCIGEAGTSISGMGYLIRNGTKTCLKVVDTL